MFIVRGQAQAFLLIYLGFLLSPMWECVNWINLCVWVWVPMSSLSSSPSFASYGTHPGAAPLSRISCGARPKRKKSNHNSEAQELVRLLTSKISNDKEPLLKTLNKYVKQVRTQHCFLLFEELAKHDNWLQCLEVAHFTPSNELLLLLLSS